MFASVNHLFGPNAVPERPPVDIPPPTLPLPASAQETWGVGGASGTIGLLDDSATIAPPNGLHLTTLYGSGAVRHPDAFQAGDLLVGRYRLEALLGVGGFGEVWGAVVEDGHSEPLPVAVKLLPALSVRDQGRVRREIAALRWARLPGVVRMIDDGLHSSTYFIVMERLEGEPFPGRRLPLSWDDLRDPALKLLEILARIHHSGLIHRDLKPRNILVDAAGQPTLLDLGIATGRALGDSFESRAYTPAYAAPEQIRAAPCDERTDLYALGVILYEALSGALPHDPHRRQPSPTHPDPIDIPGLDPALRGLLAAMMHPDPAQRPASALAVIAAMGGQLPPLLGGGGLDLPPYASAEALRALFHGPDVFLHLREDAAAELWARTNGEKSAVEAELGAWLRAGLTHWEDDALRIDRAAIERLQSGLQLALDDTPPPANDHERTLLRWLHLAWPESPRDGLAAQVPLSRPDFDAACARLVQARRIWTRPDGRLSCRLSTRVLKEWDPAAQEQARAAIVQKLPRDSVVRMQHRLRLDSTPGDILEDAVLISTSSIQSGALHRARAITDIGLSLSSGADSTPAAQKLLENKGIIAIRLRDIPEIEDCLRLINLSGLPGDPTIETLLRAQRASLKHQPHRAEELIRPVLHGTHRRDDLDIITREIFISTLSAHRDPREEQAYLEGLQDWASTAERRAKLLGWMGLYAYRSGDFRTAAAMHEDSLPYKRPGPERIGTLINAAGANLECFRLPEAISLAGVATQEARQQRLQRYESLGVWTTRMALYKSGESLSPEPGFLAPSRHIAPYIEYMFSYLEGVLCWRAGRLPQATTLIRSAARYSPDSEQGILLGLFLQYILGQRPDSSVVRQISSIKNPEIYNQCTALLEVMLPDQTGTMPRFMGSSGSPYASLSGDVRLDILSIREVEAPHTIPSPQECTP